jgi:hypothetical protein
MEQDKSIKNEIRSLVKIGLPENMAIITACANQKKSELSSDLLNELLEENREIQSMIQFMVPMGQQGELVVPLEEPTSIVVTNIEMEIVEEGEITESLKR